MTARTNKEPITKRIERRKPSQVVVDQRVQRPLDDARVQKIVDSYDPFKLGVPTLSQRADGSVVVPDGQTRLEALRRLGKGDESIDCMVYRGLTLEQEAALFVGLNDYKRPTVLDLFNIAIVQGDPLVVACHDLLEKYALRSARGFRNSFVAVEALKSAYRDDPTATERTMLALTRTWGATREAVHSTLFRGVNVVLSRYADRVNLDQLIERIQREPQGAPAQLIGRARTLAAMRSISVVDAMADILVNVYNRGRKTNTLPNWLT
jgi:uncharacterized protein DUF6551